MKKFGLFLLGIIAGITLFANLGSIIALVISGGLALVSLHYWRKSISSTAKAFWLVVLIFSVISSLSNIPAFVGIIALVGLYYVWRKWDERRAVIEAPKSDDPFTNFENEWNKLTK